VLEALGLRRKPSNLLDDNDSAEVNPLNEDQEPFFFDDLESKLAEGGFVATMYLPSKSLQYSISRKAKIRCKRGDSRITCDVVVARTLKKFNFTTFDVAGMQKGKGTTEMVPNEVSEDVCMVLDIQSKGELNFSFDSPYQRNTFFMNFAELIRLRGGRDFLAMSSKG
jgi:hypothetical protein